MRTYFVVVGFFSVKNMILCTLKWEIILCILKGILPFKMHKIILFFPENLKKF